MRCAVSCCAFTKTLVCLQLVQNRKRVTMMGDDTWMQLFPHHFERSYPFPSFNVKDLHTVCLTNNSYVVEFEFLFFFFFSSLVSNY